MPTPALQQRLESYQHWKVRVGQAIDDLATWLDAHGEATPGMREQLQAVLDSLRQDRLALALVAEPSRAKRELIESLLQWEHAGRPMPCALGRSLRCPTELLCDARGGEAYLRLLPVESRVLDIPIARLKRDPGHWTHYPLDLQHPQRWAEALDEIDRTKTVSRAEAVRLGLAHGAGSGAADAVEIPRWRYAVVSLPHPFLQHGMAILDIPGLAALGAEPELTMSLLPAAQAVLFVLAADSGVTRGDLEIWQHHLAGFQGARQRAMLVALNGVETPADSAAVQRRNAARVLGIGEEAIFPVPAAHGAGRRGGLSALEQQLATRLLEAKHRILTALVDAGVGQVLERHRARHALRIAQLQTQIEELERLRDKSQDVIVQLLEKTRREQERYLRGVLHFQQSREDLLAQIQPCRQILERENIDAMVERAHRHLAHRWTTLGLVRAMRDLFEELRRAMQSVANESEGIRKRVRAIYQGFREDFGLDLPTPQVFLPMKFRVEIELLFQEMEAFRRSPVMLLAPRGTIVRRFHEQMVSRAQVLFGQLRAACDAWVGDTLQPLADEIEEHKSLMEQRLENLLRISRSKEALQARIDEMQERHLVCAQELTALRTIHNALNDSPFAAPAVGGAPCRRSGGAA